jgi:hypothetical protein
MPIVKEHLEFHPVDLTVGWQTPAGYPDGIKEKILAGALDEKAKTGNRTRLLRFEPGARTAHPFVHDHWEEVFLLSGDLVVGDERSGLKTYGPNTYACRPPGVSHGPFQSTGGCLLFETHYYDPDGAGSTAQMT